MIRPVIPEAFADDPYEIYINPTGKFVIGGPVGDCGLTGRKIIVDTYGGYGPSRWRERSAARTRPRWTALRPTPPVGWPRTSSPPAPPSAGEVQVAYAIGMARPVSILVETFGTATVDPAKLTEAVTEVFDLRPAAISRDLDLRRPVFKPTAAYGHFGRTGDGFTWERTDRADALKAALGL